MSDSKPRRPLPTPGAPPAQRPNTPIPGALNSPSVAPSSFYGTSPPPPTRSHTIGSSFTTYVAPSDPPPYRSSSVIGFREPELVAEEPTDTMSGSTNGWQSSYWDTPSTNWKNDPWENTKVGPDGWATGRDNLEDYDPMAFMTGTKSHVDVTISGRDEHEEKNWWDPALRDKEGRPGPGMIPTMLADELHDPDHSLFSVLVSNPDIKPPVVPPSTSIDACSDQPSSSSPARTNAWTSSAQPNPTSPSATSTTAPPPPPPTDSDVRTAVPHANAYYCPKENGWVILSWKSSSVSPPYAQSFKESRHPPLPDQDRRRRYVSCLDNGPYSLSNKTHHFHKYEKAVDSHKLTQPFRLEEWEVAESVKQKRRERIISESFDVDQLDPKDLDSIDDAEDETEEGKLLDLYICCQCSMYCVASGVIPGVIPRKCFDELIRDKRANPPVGQTGELAIAAACETIIRILENKLWKGENRLLRTDRPQFQVKLGWSPNTKRTLETLGFTEEVYENQPALRPPPTDIGSSIGRMNRRRLLRAWVEVSAWLADFRRLNASHFKDLPERKTLSVQIESAREMYQTAIGAHPDQIPRGELSAEVLQASQLQACDWRNLGLTPMSFSAELLAFAYYAQVRCDPARTVEHFTSFSNIVTLMQNFPDCSQTLPEILATERSRDRFTTEDLQQAALTLGFGENRVLGVEYNETDVPEQFLENAWRACVKRSWREYGGGAELLMKANEAFRMLAEARGSETLRRVWENGKNRVMTPEKAYDTLEIPKDTDDFMLITVYNMRMDESPSQIEKMKEAMTVIAEVRDSQRLRQFLELGQDPGEIVEPTRPDLPRGLNQLGNTCYLNSLLQYFYTIKDLREAVIPMSKLDIKSVEDEKFSDDDLKRHRVGGRLVTRREIVRSKKFINQLAELFFHLEYAEAAAITPSIDLAKLALVTSRDEEEDEADSKGSTDSSNDTDATLVDDVPPRVAVTENTRSPTVSPNSVLGKRPRDIESRQPSVMDLDSPTTFPSSPNPDDFLSTTPSRQSSDSPPPLMSPSRMPEASGSGFSSQIDVEMADAPSVKPPPLPPRKPTQKSDSVMMFGKQHDVAECMDNCMFQIETALLKFDGISESQGESSDKTSVVKRLFYGKLRQRLTGPQPSRSSVHEKEDPFSHLPVNVANDGIDIYDGLNSYFDDVVEFNGEKQRMEVTLVDLPPVLQIQLQRVQFNRETLQPYKSQAYVKFGETIYLDRFMDNADLEKKTRSKVIQARLNMARERARLLVEGKDASFLTAIENTTTLVSKLGTDIDVVDDELRSSLNDEQKLLRDEIDSLRTEATNLKEELEAVWRDDNEIAYELTSVFIHRGSTPSFGHYFFYSRHLPNNPDSWFKYNDSDVTVVSKDEVLADTTGSTANPYLLVFARKGSEVVDTVKRFDPSMLEDA
ncbi:putative ubiquitin carboxyl-terminal hydrolase 2 [Termitomyces sp. J132]|nr:hypothetical protein H2248_001450 [Termitomyces sp. 'cryptogamus']KNZ81671.1 putative ubiquitin carboxyl-terminal hydrolase 2 [Termitomyces sp. J132]